MVRLAPFLIEALCELTRSLRDKTHSQTEVSGVLFGSVDDNLVTVEAIKTFKDSGPRSDLARRERMEKAFQTAMERANADPEFAAYKLLGWFSLRGSGGLINSDVEFHNTHFKNADEVALIVWHEGTTQVTAELYARSSAKLSTEDYRWSAVRLSTELRRISEPVDLMMRVRLNEDSYLRAYGSDEEKEREQEWKKIANSAKEKVRSFLPAFGKKEEETGNGLSLLPKPEPKPILKPAAAANKTNEVSGLPMVINRKPVEKGMPWLSMALVFVLFSGVTFATLAIRGLGSGTGKMSQVMRVLFPGADLELRAEGRGDRLLVTWNRKNPVVMAASKAVLSVVDGPQHFEKKLDPAQVAEGSVLYRPVSGDVTFRLMVQGADQAVARDSLRVLDATNPASAGDGAIVDISNTPAKPAAAPPPSVVAEKPPAAAPISQPMVKQAQRSNAPRVAPPDPVVPKQVPVTTAAAIPTPQQPQQQRPAQTIPPPTRTPNGAVPQTSSTAINGWDQNMSEAKPVPAVPVQAPPPQQQQPEAAAADEGRAAAFVGPKFVLQVMPKTNALPPGVITEITRVEVEVGIDERGRVTQAHLLGNPKAQLGSAAMAAAKQWTFQPATLKGQKVASSHTIVFEFRPEGQ